MNTKLFLCNTVYQIFVALWMKHSLFAGDTIDLVISDHIAGAKELHERIKNINIFNNCYYVESFKYARRQVPLSDKQKKSIRMFPNRYLKNYLNLKSKYDEIYISNVDVFSRLLYNSVVKKNPKCRLFLFEDGLSTYTKLFQSYYFDCALYFKTTKERLISKYLYREKTIFGNVSGLYLFNPQYLLWKPNFNVIKLEQINKNDASFVRVCNDVFNCSNLRDDYKEPFIFLEESFNTEGDPINDIEILENLSARVGKENIIIKRHPRDTSNRFSSRGFKTNLDFSVPWEVVLLNIDDISEKRLISVCSGSMFNPIILYNLNVKAYSIFNLVNESNKSSFTFQSDFWEVFEKIINNNPDRIFLCDSIDDIV